MRRAPVALLVAGALAVAACRGGDERAATSTTVVADDTTSSTASPVGDGSGFCDAMVAVGKVTPAGDTPEQVLAANRALAAQLAAAEASLPVDSPPDLAVLLDDYRAAVGAIDAAAGDRAAAYASLPKEVAARLASPTSHAQGYEYLVARCGITAPG